MTILKNLLPFFYKADEEYPGKWAMLTFLGASLMSLCSYFVLHISGTVPIIDYITQDVLIISATLWLIVWKTRQIPLRNRPGVSILRFACILLLMIKLLIQENPLPIKITSFLAFGACIAVWIMKGMSKTQQISQIPHIEFRERRVFLYGTWFMFLLLDMGFGVVKACQEMFADMGSMLPWLTRFFLLLPDWTSGTILWVIVMLIVTRKWPELITLRIIFLVILVAVLGILTSGFIAIFTLPSLTLYNQVNTCVPSSGNHKLSDVNAQVLKL